MEFYVVTDGGQRYGPASLSLLADWAKQGRILAETVLEEVGTGMQHRAVDILGVVSDGWAQAAPPSASAAYYGAAPGNPPPYNTGRVATQYPNPPNPGPTGYQSYTPGAWPPPPNAPGSYMLRPPYQQKNAATAVLLTLFLTGAGQMYNGQVAKGFAVLAGAILLTICTLGFGALVAVPLCMIDAGLIAGRINRGEYVGPWQFF